MDFLPAALESFRAYKQFILYLLIPKEKGKYDKVPFDYFNNRVANAHNPAIWLDADTAIGLSKLHQSQHGHGVGFVFTDKDPFWFLDVDNCITGKQANYQINELAFSLCHLLAGVAVEKSISGTGLHFFGSYPLSLHKNKNIELKLELYTKKRFVALTGNMFDEKGSAACNNTSILQVVEKYFKPPLPRPPNEWSDQPHTNWYSLSSDNELINRALQSQSAASVFGSRASFKDLWEANYDVLERVYNGDKSSYDAALAQHLAFWTGNNCDRMHHLMLQSSLVREKWEREDYLRLTILSACAKQTEFLKDKEVPKPPAPSVTTSPNSTLIEDATFLNPTQQQEYFKGCVYVCNAHKVLIPGGVLLKPDQFRAMYGGKTFAMDLSNQKVSRNAWEAFTESQAVRHQKANAECFRPDLAPAEIIVNEDERLVNKWWPISVKRKQGDLKPFFDLLNKLFLDERDRSIILSYMAAIVQHQGVKFQWAPLIQGVPGNGKTLLSWCVAEAVGHRYSHFPRAEQLAARFNDWMYGKIFISVEDVYYPEHQNQIIESLKPMITNRKIEIEPKNSPKITLDICCNFILNTNHKEGLRKAKSDRRFAPFYTPQQLAEDLKRDGMDGDYFPNLYSWLRKVGYAHITDYLYTYPITDDFNPAVKCQRAPSTSSTADAIKHGSGRIEQEILEAIEQGLVGFKGGWISSIMFDKLLERLQAGRYLSHLKRRELIQGLGYILHPKLTEGRVNNVVLPDSAKPRLFIKEGHYSFELSVAADIAKAYETDQAKI